MKSKLPSWRQPAQKREMTNAIYTNGATPGVGTDQTSEATTDLRISEFLAEHGEIEMILPVVLGLMITSRFQLRGAQALLVNLLVASISRQILFKLKNPEADSIAATQQFIREPSTPTTWGGYEVIHSIPGRVRLKIPQDSMKGTKKDAEFAKRLLQVLNDDEYVINARINYAASCLVINYQAGQLADWELGLRLMNLIKTAETEVPA